MRRALTTPSGGFLRPQADLLVLIIAGSDDASSADGELVPVSTYVDFVRTLKPEYHFVVSVIGPPDDCTNGGGTPASAPRLSTLVKSLGAGDTYVASCSQDLTAALLPIASRIGLLSDPACVDEIRDVDPDSAGLQADCAVEERIVPPDGSLRPTALPRFNPVSPP